MSEEPGFSGMERSVPELNAWLVGLLSGAISMVGTAIEEGCHVSGAADIAGGILLIALGYYWAAIVREITRDRAVSPVFFAVFFAVLAVLDATTAVCRSSLERGMFVVLQAVGYLGGLAGVWYLFVRSWKAASGMNAPFIARLAAAQLLLVTVLGAFAVFDTSPDDLTDWTDLVGIFILNVLIFAGMQYLFNRGLRNHRNPPEQPQYCTLRKALLQDGLCILLVVVVIAALCFSCEPE